MVVIKTRSELNKMREAGRVVARVLEKLREKVSEGVTTAELEEVAEAECRRLGATPAFKGYRGYPYALCCSVNEQVVHGMPGKRRLKAGDIVSLDFGCVVDGYYGDAAITVGVGEVSDEARRLMDATRRALEAAIEQMRPGRRLGDVSAAVQQVVEAAGFSVVRQFVGHGIGRQLHEEPAVPNFGVAGRGMKLRPGVVLAIEPMVNAGGYEVEILADGWTAVTKDGKLSAHFEHTVAVTEDGPWILSLP